MDEAPGSRNETAKTRGCGDGLADDLGWGLGTVFRAYVSAAHGAVAGLPGGPRGYQVLSAAAKGAVGSQLALAQHLGIDRTVMTYLLDDLEAANLIERRPDPADRRARAELSPPETVLTFSASSTSVSELLKPSSSLPSMGRLASHSAPRFGCSPLDSTRSTPSKVRVTLPTRWTQSFPYHVGARFRVAIAPNDRNQGDPLGLAEGARRLPATPTDCIDSIE